MNILACASVSDYLLHELHRRGEIVSVTRWAIQNGFERCYVHECARRLEQAGKITIEREHANGPLTLRPVTNYTPPQSGHTYQIALGI